MTEDQLRHLLLTGTAEARPFIQINVGGSPSGPRYPSRNPDEHGRTLAEELFGIGRTQSEIQSVREDGNSEISTASI
jgi:hypothetical protein